MGNSAQASSRPLTPPGISPTKQSAKECLTDQGYTDKFNRSTNETVFTYTTMNHKNIKLNWTTCQRLQRDIDQLGIWARKWGMRFQPVKCNMMQLTRKHLNKIQASYTLEGTFLENVENIKYLGVTITNDLK